MSIVPRRLAPEAGPASLVDDGRRRRGEAEYRERGGVHARVAGEVGHRDALEVVVHDVLAREVLLGFGEPHAGEAMLVEGGVVAASAETILARDQADHVRGNVYGGRLSDGARDRPRR